MNVDWILELIFSLVAIFGAIVLHEVAHGYVAYRLGDPTAKSRGRLTLNPLAHVDPIGTLLVPGVLAIMRFAFGWNVLLIGWAKPVPINPAYFRNPLRGTLYVALAGPGTNFALALIGTVLFRLLWAAVSPSTFSGTGFGGNLLQWLLYLLSTFVLYNLVLGFFNLIPVPPLDGSRILMYFLPAGGRRVLLSLERYGMFLVVALYYLGGITVLFNAVGRLWRLLLGF
ncbi:site-2 protease family protein [Candidatus Bipolaricaulota bacterium]